MNKAVLMRRLAARLSVATAVFLAAAALAIVLAAHSGDPTLWPPRPGEAIAPITIVSHGYHTGLVLRRSDLLNEAEKQNLHTLQEVLERFRAFDDLELGWGDEGFYHHVRTLGDLQITEALRALFRPGNTAVMHVVGLTEAPRQAFPQANILVLSVSQTGFARLTVALDQSFHRDQDMHPQEMGTGLYGPSLFYRATGAFSLFNVCNHWVAHLLAAAGLPSNPFLSTLAEGLLLDLRLRAHARLLPALDR